MEEIANLITNYGVSIVIVALFIWDWVTNKKETKKTLNAIQKSNENIASCLTEMKQSNVNISKSLDLLQKSLDNQTEKIDRLLERRIGNE